MFNIANVSLFTRQSRSPWENYYLSNCMLPPLASTSCTEMLIPLLLLMNGLLFDEHEFELKRQHLNPCVRTSFHPLSCSIISPRNWCQTSLYATAYCISPILPGHARRYSSDAEYPGVADSVTWRNLRWFRTQAQHTHLTDVTVTIADPDVLWSLSVRQRWRRASKLKTRSRLPDR